MKTRAQQLKEAIRDVERAGKEPGEVAFAPDGTIRIVLRQPETAQETRKWSLV